MPAPYGIHISTTKFILLLEYNIEQLPAWSLCNYDRYSSVTLMQHQLSWQNLQQRRKIARLLLLYKTLYDHIALQIPPYYTLSYSNTRANHQFSFIHPSTRTNFYMYSFYPKTINNGIVSHQIWHRLSPQQNFIN